MLPGASRAILHITGYWCGCSGGYFKCQHSFVSFVVPLQCCPCKINLHMHPLLDQNLPLGLQSPCNACIRCRNGPLRPLQPPDRNFHCHALNLLCASRVWAQATAVYKSCIQDSATRTRSSYLQKKTIHVLPTICHLLEAAMHLLLTYTRTTNVAVEIRRMVVWGQLRMALVCVYYPLHNLPHWCFFGFPALLVPFAKPWEHCPLTRMAQILSCGSHHRRKSWWIMRL